MNTIAIMPYEEPSNGVSDHIDPDVSNSFLLVFFIVVLGIMFYAKRHEK